MYWIGIKNIQCCIPTTNNLKLDCFNVIILLENNYINLIGNSCDIFFKEKQKYFT